jgi:peptidoglycan/LPS O-acetylase OafA/YrhL
MGGPWIFIIVMVMMGIPFAAFILGAWTEWLVYRHRKNALEAIKVYAQNGRDPPPELLNAVSRSSWVSGMMTGGARAPDAESEGEAPRRMFRRHREPLRSWRHAIVFLAICAGFGAAALMAGHSYDHPFYIVAIVMGAMGFAFLLYAIVATFFREK